MARYTNPRDVYFGAGAIKELSMLKGHKKAFVITGGSSMRKTGALGRLEKTLEDAGLSVILYEGIEPDPSVETVMRGAQKMQEEAPDVIVAIGGGSALDAAKAMWIFYEYPQLKFPDVITPFSLPPLRRKAIFVAIPSTSGTASEVTAFSVITDRQTAIKYPLADFELTPDIAVLDTDLPMSMGERLCAHTGLDALTHAMEAYVAAARSCFTDAMALESIVLLFEALEQAYQGNRTARETVHLAQCMAGMAFSSALLGIAHSLAHKTGAVFDLPHGLCNAILLPHVIRFNAGVCASRYAAVARRLGLEGGSDLMLTERLIDRINTLAVHLQVPRSYRDAGVSEAVFQQKRDFIVENALKDPCTSSNPCPVSPEEMRAVLENAYGQASEVH